MQGILGGIKAENQRLRPTGFDILFHEFSQMQFPIRTFHVRNLGSVFFSKEVIELPQGYFTQSFIPAHKPNHKVILLPVFLRPFDIFPNMI